jgi:hypothetical protein
MTEVIRKRKEMHYWVTWLTFFFPVHVFQSLVYRMV